MVSLGSGNQGGYIKQTVNTIPSQYYKLSFNLGADLQSISSEKTRTVKVGLFDGTTETTYTYNITANQVATSYDSYGWQNYNINFYANSTTTTISFSGYTTNHAYGPVLDNICLTLDNPPPPEQNV